MGCPNACTPHPSTHSDHPTDPARTPLRGTPPRPDPARLAHPHRNPTRRRPPQRPRQDLRRVEPHPRRHQIHLATRGGCSAEAEVPALACRPVNRRAEQLRSARRRWLCRLSSGPSPDRSATPPLAERVEGPAPQTHPQARQPDPDAVSVRPCPARPPQVDDRQPIPSCRRTGGGCRFWEWVVPKTE